MKYTPFFQNKLKNPQKFKYNTNILQQGTNQYIFGVKQQRDITPFRKYNQFKNSKTNKNIKKNKLLNNRQIKIEEDFISSSTFPFKKTRTPLNKSQKNYSSNKYLINKNNINSISLNNSIKLNKPLFRPPPQKSNRLFQNTKFGMSYNNSFLNKSFNLTRTNRVGTPLGKLNLTKSSSFGNPKSLKLNRSITPNPKSKVQLGLSKSNSKFNFDKKNLKQNKIGNKSPIFSMKKKNILAANSISSKSLYPKNNINSHYSNIFKAKNIFSTVQKNKNKVITINMNINQNYLSTSSKHNLNEINKTSFSDNISTYNINNNSSHNLNLNIINRFTENSQIESNNSILISGMKKENNKENNLISNITKMKNENENEFFNDKNEQENKIPKEIRKKILCMHEFSKTGYAGEDEKKVNQDNYFVFRNFVNNVNYIFMAVCDGHGAVGQEISSYLKENLPIDLNHALRKENKDILKDDISSIITDIFKKENTKLISNEMINSMLSGSTCVSVIYTPIKLITANVGDSRIILGRFDPFSQQWNSIDLTRDHKPSLPD